MLARLTIKLLNANPYLFSRRFSHMNYKEIRALCTECLFNIKTSLDDPLKGKKGRGSSPFNDLPILLPFLTMPYATAEMIVTIYSDQEDEALTARLTMRLLRLCKKDAGKKYRFSDRTYQAPLRTEGTKYEKQNVYSLTADGIRLVHDLAVYASSGDKEMKAMLSPVLGISEEALLALREYYQNAPLSNHSMSICRSRAMIYSLAENLFSTDQPTAADIDIGTFIRDIEFEKRINPDFERISGSDAGELACTRIPDISMTYFCGNSYSPFCIEIDMATERTSEIYAKIDEELAYLMGNPGRGAPSAPIVFIAQFENEGKKAPEKKSETRDFERYTSLLKKPGIADSLLVYMAAYESSKKDSPKECSLEDFIRDTEDFLIGTKIEKYPEELLFLLSFYEDSFYEKLSIGTFQNEYRINRFAERRYAAERKNSLNRLHAKRQLYSLRTRDAENGMHSLWRKAYRGCSIASSGYAGFKDGLRTLLPFEFCMGECLRIIRLLSRETEHAFSLYDLAASAAVCRIENGLGVSMRNTAFLKTSDGSEGRRFCFEDISSDLGAIYRLEEYVAFLPTGIASDMMAVFLIDDDEVLADGRKLSEFCYWEGSGFKSVRDDYLRRFNAAYGECAVSVPVENGIRSDFVFLKKSEFFGKGADISDYHFYIRFGSRVIDRTVEDLTYADSKMIFMENFRSAFTNLRLPGLKL